ncbi:hypothetical protein BC941DRAFT_200824 [Chlamydoabsidia padenii]|nr:hypothetical protein BC941DRAFT_200824 [Chlamydoabsidia padenii]
MNQSKSECQDAFSQILDTTPPTKHNQLQLKSPNHDRQQGLYSHHRHQHEEQQQQKRLSSNSRKGHSINRLSRMFENDTSIGRHSNATHTQVKLNKPTLPTKPPSLRSGQPTNNTSNLVNDNSTVNNETTTKMEDSTVDETSLAFRDVRARFQQNTLTGNRKNMQNNLTLGRSLNNQHGTPNHSESTRSSLQTPSHQVPTKPSMSKRLDSMNLDSSSTIRPTVISSVNTTDQTTTLAEKRSSHSRRGPTPPTPPTRDDDSLGSLNTRLLIPKRTSQATLQPQHFTPGSPHVIVPPASSTGSSSLSMISRSGTGNSSVFSGISTSSLSSTSSSTSPASPSTKRVWNSYGSTLSHWFSGNNTDHHQQQQSLKDSISTANPTTMHTSDPPPSIYGTSFDSSCTPLSSPTSVSTSNSTTTSLPHQSTGTAAIKEQNKRVKVMDEIWKTETSYQNDMLVLKEIYYDPALEPDSGLSLSDVKHVFSNLLAIVDLESTFVDLLSRADEDSTTNTIGMAFRTMMQQIDQVYCDYCKRHTDAVIRLQELESKPKAQQFLQVRMVIQKKRNVLK